jgi:hypothetical protein
MKMDIKQTFLNLTSKTYPHGSEGELFPLLYSEIDGLQVDEFGNLFVKVGESDVMFTSHLDTATSVKPAFDPKLMTKEAYDALFDDETGLYSCNNPGLVFGTVNSITPEGIASITWIEDGSSNYCKLRDLTVVRPKRNVKSILAAIIALLVKGKPIKKKKQSNIFYCLIKV